MNVAIAATELESECNRARNILEMNKLGIKIR